MHSLFGAPVHNAAMEKDYCQRFWMSNDGGICSQLLAYESGIFHATLLKKLSSNWTYIFMYIFHSREIHIMKRNECYSIVNVFTSRNAEFGNIPFSSMRISVIVNELWQCDLFCRVHSFHPHIYFDTWFLYLSNSSISLRMITTFHFIWKCTHTDTANSTNDKAIRKSVLRHGDCHLFSVHLYPLFNIRIFNRWWTLISFREGSTWKV